MKEEKLNFVVMIIILSKSVYFLEKIIVFCGFLFSGTHCISLHQWFSLFTLSASGAHVELRNGVHRFFYSRLFRLSIISTGIHWVSKTSILQIKKKVYNLKSFIAKRVISMLVIWDIWDLSCWNIKKIIRKFVILLIVTSKICLYIYNEKGITCILYYTMLPLRKKFQKWRLTRFAIKVFI